MQVKHLIQLLIDKLLTKPGWVIKSLFYLFWHWFLTLSYKLQVAATRENEKELHPEIFLSYQKKIFFVDAFIILRLSVNDFRVRTKGKNNKITRNSRRSDILTLLTLLSADAKSALLLRSLSLTKVQVRNSSLLYFSKWLFGSWTTCYVSVTCEKVGHM